MTKRPPVPSKPPASPLASQAAKPERIAKIIAAAGVCSRRDAERLIADGRVTVNGTVLDTPAITVTPQDRVLVDGRPLIIPTAETKQTRLWLLHKPSGWVTTAHDPQGRPTVFDNLPKRMGRVISVGRLDLNSEGLLLLTNDGALARAMELPRTGLSRTYHVRVYGDLDVAALDALQDGIVVDGVTYGAITVDIDRIGARNAWLRMVLHEGKNREIRRVLQSMGLHVNRLIRVGYGPFELGELEQGKVTEIDTRTLQAFCHSMGLIQS